MSSSHYNYVDNENSNSNRNSRNMELDSDIVSLSTEYTQSSTKNNNKRNSKTTATRPTRRKVSMATRRRSRLLYLEKYGLNQPDWHTSQDDYHHQNDDVNSATTMEYTIEYTDEPEGMIKSPTTTTTTTTTKPVKRPVSIRNFVQSSISQKRPKRFVKPQKSNSDYMSFPASEFKHVHRLMDEYTEKVYMEGYLYKRNDFNSNGSSCGIKKWSPWYVELCGPVLTLWDNSSSSEDKEVFPQYINITDSTVQIEDRLTAETRPNLFSLNSAGANRFMLQAADPISLSKWILAIRLSCFECSRIQEIYTRAFITRPQFKTTLTNKSAKMDGFVQVRFPGSTGWKKFWACVSSTRVEKKLFSKKIVPTGGQIMFYESKKAKYPVMTLQNVVQVYTVYPESPKLINMATLFKIEGSLFKNKSNNEQLVSASSSALVMTSNTNELVQWLITLFNAFKLYGRPDTLIDDTNNQASLNFAENILGSRLFLEPQDVYSVSSKNDLLSNKKDFAAILLDRLINGTSIPIPDSIPLPLTPASTTTATVMDDHLISSDSTENTAGDEQRRRSARSLISNQLGKNGLSQPTHLRTVTSASDVSDEDEDDDVRQVDESESDSDSDSDEFLFKLGTTPTINKSRTKPSPISSYVKPITPNASKSSSEISDVSPSVPIATDLFLPPVSSIEHNSFSSSVLSETNHHFNQQQQQQQQQKYFFNEETMAATSDSEEGYALSNYQNSKSKKKKPFYSAQHYGQQRSNSMVMTPKWPMYGSTASIVAGDYHNNNNNHNWETSSVDPHMMMSDDSNNNYFSSHESIHQPYYASTSMLNAGGYNNNNGNNDDDMDDDDIPIASSDRLFTQNSLLEQASSSQDRFNAKSIEKHAKATGKPLVNIPAKQVAPRAGLLGVIQEKELENKSQDYQRNRAMMDEQLLMQERIMMEQRQQQLMMFQYMQQQYANGMIPMMMPMMDPRMIPMLDPRLMTQQPMMMDPRFISPPNLQLQPQMTPIPSSSTGSTHSNSQYKHKSRFQQYCNDNRSVDGISTSTNGRVKTKRPVSSSASFTNSIQSTSNSGYPSSARRTRNNS